eukprot:1069888-Amorphochlora_amoeboformis.AAC.1
MEYLHSNTPRITHRDLKPANVLLDKTWVHAKDKSLTVILLYSLWSGTTPYMAPEALSEQDIVSAKVDVYSFG